MIKEVARIAQECGGIRKTRPASYGRTRWAQAQKAVGQDAGFEKGIEVSFDEDAREPPLNRRGYNGAAGFRRFDNGEVP
jgi:hypothetical protein